MALNSRTSREAIRMIELILLIPITSDTVLVWPSSVCSEDPLAASQSLTVVSSLELKAKALC